MRIIKRLVLVLGIVLIATTHSYAVEIIDELIYKEVVLKANRSAVRVNRITGEVKYIKLNNGRWDILTGGLKNKCQLMYDNQIASQ